MNKITDLHCRWSKDDDYQAVYEALDKECQLARVLIEAHTPGWTVAIAGTTEASASSVRALCLR